MGRDGGGSKKILILYKLLIIKIYEKSLMPNHAKQCQLIKFDNEMEKNL